MRWIALVVALLSSPAFAQQPQPFTPFTVEEADAKALRAYLDEQPMKFSLPIAQWIEQMQQKAREKAMAAKDDQKK